MAISTKPLRDAIEDETFLLEVLSDTTNQPIELVRERWQKEQEDLGCQVRTALQAQQVVPHIWDERLARFYAETDAFLFETLVWNRHPAKADMRQWIIEYLARGPLPLRTLTYGDGLGIDSLALTLAGHDVEYFEVSQQCVRFAQALGAKVGVQPNFIDSADKIPLQSYDLVVCLDVLEHVPDPPATVALLASYLRPGGRLITHAPFWYLHPAVVTHLAANQKYSGSIRRLYGSHQLELIEGRFFWAPLVFEKRAAQSKYPSMSTRTRLNLAVSGLLLSFARVWAQPIVAAVRYVARLNKNG